nr:amidohydrolase family protein [Akkermansiaceae bacterium]
MISLLAPQRLWDGNSPGYAPADTAVRIEGDRIVAVGSRAALAPGAEVIELPDLCLLPGLIDAHVHLCLDPGRRGRDAEDPAGAPRRAEAMVRRGITTARDLGSAGDRVLRLRDEIRRGERLGPRLLGPPLTTPGGHCHFWGGVVRDAGEIRLRVADQAKAGFDWIKVMATGGVLTQGTRPSAPQFELDQLEGLVGAAASAGLPVAAHCHGTPGMDVCARAGVRSLEHASFAGPDGFGTAFDPDVCRRIADAGAFVAPTVHANWRRFLHDAEKAPANPDFAQRMSLCYAGLREAGVPLVASTDAGIPGARHEALAEALPVWARFGELSPREALGSATSGSAAALGLAEETGAIRAGLSADFLGVRGDPLASLEVLREPA